MSSFEKIHDSYLGAVHDKWFIQFHQSFKTPFLTEGKLHFITELHKTVSYLILRVLNLATFICKIPLVSCFSLKPHPRRQVLHVPRDPFSLVQKHCYHLDTRTFKGPYLGL